jgi:hypothetical protein
MALIVLRPFTSFLGKENLSLKGRKRPHPLAYGLRGLIIEQPSEYIAVALTGTSVAPEPPSDILFEGHGCVGHKLKIHYAVLLSECLLRLR